MSPATQAPRRRPAKPTWKERADSFVTLHRLAMLLCGIALGGLSLTAAGVRELDGVRRDRRQIAANTEAIARIEEHLRFQTCVSEATMDGVSPRACASLRPRR